ncbi:MAG: DNA mismatch repair endonuclease MutL [Chlamydiia bacterium]|nr:DNA mismatch repair endonuclease MutL [Chlamydiia bacterium]
MIAKIARLSEPLINQIAAGEVVENPASVVKELIENCLDAKARSISVWIEGGGERLIRVEDDGCGMGREDALLSLERHATSKVRLQEDLERLVTMGFRGEALAAIAAISHLEMKTSEETGYWIRAEGGSIVAQGPCARNRGTTIEVRSLFFNVPARKKFLKSPSANTAQIIRMIETIALAYPEIFFSLRTDGKTVLEVMPTAPKKRIEQLLGSMPHEVASDHLWGFLTPASEAKTHRRGQHLFVNLRPVFSPLISKAVKAGYGVRIDERSHPSFVLFLDIDPGSVDVNVHPQKREVRFADEAKVFQIVQRGVASAFETSTGFAESISFSPPPPCPFVFLEKTASPRVFQESGNHAYAFDFTEQERPLAVVDGYLLLQNASLLLIDLRAAHARVLYESLQSPQGAAQALLWPLEILAEEETVQTELEAMGIECRWTGKKTLAIDALPPFLEENDFPQFLQAWQEGKRIDDVANRYARAVKKRFTLEEAHFLWQQVQRCKESKFDPKGKRIWASLDETRLRTLLDLLSD